MRSIRVWARLLGLCRTVIEDVTVNDAGEVIICVRPGWRERDRCPFCRRRCGRFDQGAGRRLWRCLDLGSTFCFLEADAPRVRCRRHGVVVAAVPWARHGARFTASFEDQVCWLAVNCSKTAVAELMRVSWRAVGNILERVCAEQQAKVDLLDGLRRIGTRSRTDAVSGTSRSWLTMTAAGWCGPLQAGTPRPPTRSLTLWAKSAVNRSSWCPRTWPAGSLSRSPSGFPRRSGAWIRFMSFS